MKKWQFYKTIKKSGNVLTQIFSQKTISRK